MIAEHDVPNRHEPYLKSVIAALSEYTHQLYSDVIPCIECFLLLLISNQ
ncbi:hypothetical protein HSR122_1664 [Halapricum desulfuricans]|uniref:Uncharacterized protein n=1 Tax=Halapricum desulfuricans TaxID=2841257 RepID=A0A897NC89_9EURY|nr:hypothetical protein HSR122_1664 [Halapricum desulfuricans]